MTAASEIEGRTPMSSITLRDYLAGQAIGAIASICVADTLADRNKDYPAYCAKKAYDFADAMLAERSK